MTEYVKTIEQSDTGMVIASVVSVATGKRVGLAFFHLAFGQKHRLKRAHAWADRWIKNCQTYCIERPSPALPQQGEGEQ